MMLALSACASLAPEGRQATGDALAAMGGWHKLSLDAGKFVLTAYVPVMVLKVKTLTIYIEGDGMAWQSRHQISDDPTPVRPLALELALQHAIGAAVYLARPCQYAASTGARSCDPGYWTRRRFSPEVIAATSVAIDALKRRHGASDLMLVGYSGGAAVAALVAANRSDVTRLVTVAGTLDHGAWTSLHQVSPLDGSLNPADAWAKLLTVPQVHFVGGKDPIAPLEIAQAYSARFPKAQRPEIRVVPGFDHLCCWVDRWRTLSVEAFSRGRPESALREGS